MPFVDYERLKFDYRNRVLWITIDAGKMNAVDFEMHEELARVFPEANLNKKMLPTRIDYDRSDGLGVESQCV